MSIGDWGLALVGCVRARARACACARARVCACACVSSGGIWETYSMLCVSQSIVLERNSKTFEFSSPGLYCISLSSSCLFTRSAITSSSGLLITRKHAVGHCAVYN